MHSSPRQQWRLVDKWEHTAINCCGHRLYPSVLQRQGGCNSLTTDDLLQTFSIASVDCTLRCFWPMTAVWRHHCCPSASRQAVLIRSSVNAFASTGAISSWTVQSVVAARWYSIYVFWCVYHAAAEGSWFTYSRRHLLPSYLEPIGPLKAAWDITLAAYRLSYCVQTAIKRGTTRLSAWLGPIPLVYGGPSAPAQVTGCIHIYAPMTIRHMASAG